MLPNRPIFSLLFTAIFLAMTPPGLISQTAPPFAHFNPRFEIAELPGGAAGNSVQDMAVDRYGFLWLGSQAGLHRYDGRNFTTFTHEPTNPNSLAGNFIESIFIDKKGNLWLGHMGAGLTRFDPVTNTFTRFLPIAGDTMLANQLEVRGMVEDSAGYIWAGSFGEGLYRLNPATNEWKRFLHEEKNTRERHIARLYVDRQGVLWVGTWDGLYRRSAEDTSDDFQKVPGVQGYFISGILEDSEGHFWIGTYPKALLWLDCEKLTFKQWTYDPANPGQLSPPTLRNVPEDKQQGDTGIFEDQEKRVWIFSGGALNVYDLPSKQYRHFEPQPEVHGSLPANFSIMEMAETQDGVIWLSSGSDGKVVRINPEGNLFSFYGLRDKQAGISPSCILEDRAGYVWMGTTNSPSGALLRFDRKTGELLHFPASGLPGKLPSRNVYSLMEDRSGFIWAGTSEGLVKLNPQTFHFQQVTLQWGGDEGSPYYLQTTSLMQDRGGKIWVATNGNGLHRIDPQTGEQKAFWHDPTQPGSIGGDWVVCVREDPQGHIWTSGGMYIKGARIPIFFDRLNDDGETFTHFAPDGEFGEAGYLSPGIHGNVWFTGYLNGIQKLDPESGIITYFTTKNSAIPTDNYTLLFTSKNGIVWLGNGKDLVAFDPSKSTSRSFGEVYGIRMQSSLYNGFFENEQGEIFFTGEGGFYVFKPEKVASLAAPAPAPVQITGLTVNDDPVFPGDGSILKKPVWETDFIRLKNEKNNFTFSLSNFSFSNPGENAIEFMLENYDPAWRTDLRNAEAVYLNVPSGQYVFRARSTNALGEKGPETSIRLNVLPPWWRTWWAISIFAALILGVAAAIFRLRLRNRLEHAESIRLREMDELKTSMFANITHEFRTPLTLIGGMAELLQNDPNHQHRERTDAIQRNASKVLRLVDQMLNLARLEAGSMPLQPVQGDVAAFLRHVFQSYPGLAEYRKVRLHYLPENEGFTMDFDPEKLEDVVGNLLSNALKYTPAGGDVYFSFHTTKSDPEQFVIRVKDTGIGIPADKLGHIFERFYRVEEGQKHYEEGSGIGLTLVREYVKLMGGEIAVQSKPNEGTEFTVTLPLTRQAVLKKDVVAGRSTPEFAEVPFVDVDFSETPNQQPTSPLLLLIEDNPELSQYLQLVLGPKFQLLTAANGEEGIEMAIEHVPDLILSDVMMPVKDGFEVCRTLKKDFRTCHIPIVLLTARADTASRITGLELGADAYLTKPFNQRELFACLRNLFIQREKLRIKYAAQPTDGEPAPTPGMDELFLSKVRSILEENFADEAFGIESLYNALGISRVQLHRKLTALTGQSASQFIRSFRLEKARELLTTSLQSVSEIAFETGFTDPNYFSRVFAQEYGMPPSDLRKGQENKAGN